MNQFLSCSHVNFASHALLAPLATATVLSSLKARRKRLGRSLRSRPGWSLPPRPLYLSLTFDSSVSTAAANPDIFKHKKLYLTKPEIKARVRQTPKYSRQNRNLEIRTQGIQHLKPNLIFDRRSRPATDTSKNHIITPSLMKSSTRDVTSTTSAALLPLLLGRNA
jgi:hypothetical protein